MELKKTLSERLGIRDITLLCHTCCGQDGDMVKSELFSLFSDSDARVGYNALWVFTHLTRGDRLWLLPMRSRLIDMLLIEKHDGKDGSYSHCSNNYQLTLKTSALIFLITACQKSTLPNRMLFAHCV